MKRFFAAIAVACLLVSACGNDDDSSAERPPATQAPAAATESAATPEPTMAPEPAATPEPTEAAEEEEPPPSLDTLVFDTDTTGGDVLERLTDDERDCTQTALGDEYGLLAATPLMSIRDVGVGPGLYGCLAHENLLTFGTAFISLRFGGQTSDTTECIREVYDSTPSVLYRIFGLEWEGGSASPEDFSSTTQNTFQCMTPRERTNWLLGLWNRLAASTADRGRNFVELLTADEIQCASEAVGEEASEEVLGQNPVQVWRSYPAAHDCFSPATKGKLFAHFTANQVGGITDSSLQCLEEFASQRPDFVDAIADGPAAASFEADADVSQFTIEAFAMYGCLTSEERGRLQDIFLQAGQES